MTLTAQEVEQLKHAPAVPRVLPVVLERWSPRSFDASRNVSSEDLRILFEAARWAASSSNEQPWRWIVGLRGPESGPEAHPETQPEPHHDAYNKIFQSLGEWNQAWAGSAPVLVLGLAKASFSKDGSANQYAMHDLGAADATLCYQATALGLHSHQMAGFDHALARRLFNIPEDYHLGSVNAIGYLGEPAALKVEYQRNLETVPRTRKPLAEIVFSGWEQPLDLI
ncbi:MAG TPA: nitroreductase family protein [Terracidiphilus sp.]